MADLPPIIDTHHHFWRLDRGDYHWMPRNDPILTRDYLPGDLAPSLRKAGIDRTILVQAAATEAETEFLLALAQDTPFVAGVCGWLDMEADDFPDRLAKFAANPYFRSFRPMLQDLADPAWILRPKVMANLAHVAQTQVIFEVLSKPDQLPHAIEAIRATPGLTAIVNHLSKPPIAAGTMTPWADQMAEFAAMPGVSCKISGMVTEADHANWSPNDLAPYVSHVLDVFGPDRVMYGSDWPVALLAASDYAEVINALRTIVAPYLDKNGLQKLFCDNAARVYRL